ncbi:MAG: hypothetical protein FE041_03285 [Thermoplasmata archaeon]|nr:MAG: hypothetical protein FE041_03285 [Thermoplasmata archaeon]
MTSEVAIMNTQAIALASDSAVTFGQRGQYKIKYSANKIFRLSETQPVGIMTYGNANFMGLPWETIIKLFRKKIGRDKYNYLEDYINEFFNFLEDKSIFTELLQKRELYGLSIIIFGSILNEIKKKVKYIIQKTGKITEYKIKQISDEIINKRYIEIDRRAILKGRKKADMFEIMRNYQKEIDKAIKDVFQELPMFKKSVKRLHRLMALFCIRDIFLPTNRSGIVIAGFGEKDLFPKIYDYWLDIIINNKLKKKLRKRNVITYDNRATISYFAQGEMVYSFMEGIDPYLLEANNKYLKENIFDKYPEIIVGEISGLNKAQKEQLKEKLKEKSRKLYETYIKEMKTYRQVNHVKPIMDVVKVLPKDELALMAETLVNLQSFKRKVSREFETVGGPIDVAVISKGDGFTWIKRKQYFKPELNKHLYLKQYIEIDDEEK